MTKSKRKEKDFDCVAFKQDAQKRIYRELKDLTRAEELEFFESRTDKGPFADWLKKVREAARTSPGTR